MGCCVCSLGRRFSVCPMGLLSTGDNREQARRIAIFVVSFIAFAVAIRMTWTLNKKVASAIVAGAVILTIWIWGTQPVQSIANPDSAPVTKNDVEEIVKKYAESRASTQERTIHAASSIPKEPLNSPI